MASRRERIYRKFSRGQNLWPMYIPYIYIYPIYPTIMDNLRLLHCYNWWFLGDYTFYRWGSLSILVTSISGHNCRDGPQGFYDFLLKLSIDPKTILDRRVMIRGGVLFGSSLFVQVYWGWPISGITMKCAFWDHRQWDCRFIVDPTILALRQLWCGTIPQST